MKRIISIFIVTVMVFGLVACGSSKDVESSSNAPSETTNTVAQVETKTEKPTETQTETQTESKFTTMTREILFSKVYVSKETCEKIVNKLDGLEVNQGDTLDLGDIGFSDQEKSIKSSLKSTLASICLSNYSSKKDTFVSNRYVKFNVSYDEEKITIMYTVYN